MEVIKAALEQSNTNVLKEKMRTVANVFVTHTQMGEAGAVYRLLPSLILKSQMLLANGSLKCKKKEHQGGEKQQKKTVSLEGLSLN
jgi:hypothetical protein